MCQYSSRCPIGHHNPGTVCRYKNDKWNAAALLLLLLVAIALCIYLFGRPR